MEATLNLTMKVVGFGTYCLACFSRANAHADPRPSCGI